ncbi:hypothetical protein [Kribbella pratensis]|uniref:Tachylectin n=1 Tax=Kribbella pratensis TaxID=2512112 RepID=A0A4R8C3K1_9ACTN|nr:hypothetical protein [Kribbella pratensis]TDW70392.1 hypothetical protein EV653_4435 [Kribbella pratensis]
MRLQRLALAMAGMGLLAASVVSAPATASTTDSKPWSDRTKQTNTTKAGTACLVSAAFPSAAGTVSEADAIAGRPAQGVQYDPFKFVGTRANATWYLASNAALTQFYYYGLLLQGGNLYRHTTYIYEDDRAPLATFKKVGSGWTSFKTIATSNLNTYNARHAFLYGLNSNGSLYRYSIVGAGIKSYGSFPGFKGFKAMTVISENAAYDTLLMTTTAGALWSVRIPTAASTKPILKRIRSGGWQNFESLVVENCGTRGGLLILGVDNNTQSGTLYAMSKANGAATALTGYGPIQGVVFNGVDTVREASYYDQLVGE